MYIKENIMYGIIYSCIHAQQSQIGGCSGMSRGRVFVAEVQFKRKTTIRDPTILPKSIVHILYIRRSRSDFLSSSSQGVMEFLT